MCLDVLDMHGEVEEVWSGGAACWFDRTLVPCRTPRAHPPWSTRSPSRPCACWRAYLCESQPGVISDHQTVIHVDYL